MMWSRLESDTSTVDELLLSDPSGIMDYYGLFSTQWIHYYSTCLSDEAPAIFKSTWGWLSPGLPVQIPGQVMVWWCGWINHTGQIHHQWLVCVCLKSSPSSLLSPSPKIHKSKSKPSHWWIFPFGSDFPPAAPDFEVSEQRSTSRHRFKRSLAEIWEPLSPPDVSQVQR